MSLASYWVNKYQWGINTSLICKRKPTHSISDKHRHSIFMYNMNNSRLLQPCLSINLNRYRFVCYRDLHCVTLRYPTVLHSTKYFRHAHLAGSQNSNNFKHSIVERWRIKPLSKKSICEFNSNVNKRCILETSSFSDRY